ncbi:MAG: major capsid protein [Microvirus sp.]|nr:MAG: major capsid protein [Microvirus sp.]
MFSSGNLPANTGRAQHTFSRSPQANIPRSQFDRSHGHKTTFNEGYLVPIFVDEALPGDTFSLNMTAFARLATPLFPIMDNMYLESFFFAVPYRLVWDNWARFNGEQTNPGDSTDYVIPTCYAPEVTGWEVGSIGDYFGLPVNIEFESQCSALPFRAYNLIYNEWFRDENLQDSLPVPKDNGPDLAANYGVVRRNKRYDYFTSCLPWPQKGAAVDIPLGTSAAIRGLDRDTTVFSTGAPSQSRLLNVGSVNNVELSGASVSTGQLRFSTATDGVGLYADLENATTVTINSLRESVQIQRLLERDARGGTRYTEVIRSHFGVLSPDARLQRPEYLGGGSQPIVISPVAQTSATDGTNPLGQLAAVGTCAVNGHGFTKSFTEHCIIMGLINVRSDLNYQSGMNRMWSRVTRYDFYWPALSHLGEQEVYNREIFFVDDPLIDDLVFGYQERYAEYRYKPSQITGLFRSEAAGTLDSWHLAQDFSVTPVLNDEFIVEDAPMARIKAVVTQPDFLFDSHIRFRCVRPMPLYSVPGLMDHF